ncbi:hypothetical protein BBJ66_03125 [Rhizobium sp. RSm-3]|nr:hypothetical protein BBJ66_03125 [Rhizobium sp. RSm-3]
MNVSREDGSQKLVLVDAGAGTLLGPIRLPLWGDIVHVAAVQFADPTVTIGYDVDQAEAEREHWRVFDDAARSRNMIGGAYLPFPGLGHVRDNGDKTSAYVPLN